MVIRAFKGSATSTIQSSTASTTTTTTASTKSTIRKNYSQNNFNEKKVSEVAYSKVPNCSTNSWRVLVCTSLQDSSKNCLLTKREEEEALHCISSNQLQSEVAHASPMSA